MASTVLGSPYADRPFEEQIPPMLTQPMLKKASLIQERSNVRQVPQGGQLVTNTGPYSTTFILEDSSRFLDLNSIRLSGFFRTPAGGNTGILCDGITSLIQRMRVLVDGMVVEDIQFVAQKAAMEIYQSMPLEHYQSEASALGLYHKYDTKFSVIPSGVIASVSGANATINTTLADALLSQLKNYPSRRHANVVAVQNAGEWFSLPLSYVLGFFRSPSAFPLLKAKIQLIIDWQPNAVAAFKVATPTDWRIEDLSVEYDALLLHPLYTRAFMDLCESSEGYVLPVTTHTVAQLPVQSSNGLKAIVVPSAVSRVRQVSWGFQSASDYASTSADKTAFGQFGYVDGYIQVGSQRFPQHPCTGTARALALTLDADNLLGNIATAPIMDSQNYCGVATVAGVANDPTANCFIWSCSLDKVKDTFIALDGQESVGGMVSIYVNNNLTAQSICTVVIETTRFLAIRNNSVSVM